MNTAVRLLEKTAQKFPNNPALEMGDNSLTYLELVDKAKSIGTYILGRQPKLRGIISPILIYLPKSVEAVTSFMGVLFSGNPYVPLDYNIPAERLVKIYENLRPKFVVTNSNGAEFIKENLDIEILLYEDMLNAEIDEIQVQNAINLVTDAEPIYIMYTSGSTGIPKGVTIPHRGVIDYANWVATTFQIDEYTIMGNQSALFFDNSVLDIYGAFSTGAKLILIPEQLFMFPVKIPEFINANDINFVFFVPTVMINIANSGVLANVKMPKLTKVLFCGEEMPNKQLNIWRKNHSALYANLYGPTEITDVCSYYIIDREFADTDPLPIGKPCENMDIIILNEQDELAKEGEQGELCVLGSGVALGYWGTEEKTRAVFMQNPVNTRYDERMYRTGDIAYWMPDGLIGFVGRKDSQIKLKGNRIELGDIETATKSINGIDNAAILFDSENQEIVAFLESNIEWSIRKLNVELMKKIPKYMLPARLVVYEKLPLTPNGKIDRVKLKGTFNAEMCHA